MTIGEQVGFTPVTALQDLVAAVAVAACEQLWPQVLAHTPADGPQVALLAAFEDLAPLAAPSTVVATALGPRRVAVAATSTARLPWSLLDGQLLTPAASACVVLCWADPVGVAPPPRQGEHVEPVRTALAVSPQGATAAAQHLDGQVRIVFVGQDRTGPQLTGPLVDALRRACELDVTHRNDVRALLGRVLVRNASSALATMPHLDRDVVVRTSVPLGLLTDDPALLGLDRLTPLQLCEQLTDWLTWTTMFDAALLRSHGRPDAPDEPVLSWLTAPVWANRLLATTPGQPQLLVGLAARRSDVAAALQTLLLEATWLERAPERPTGLQVG